MLNLRKLIGPSILTAVPDRFSTRASSAVRSGDAQPRSQRRGHNPALLAPTLACCVIGTLAFLSERARRLPGRGKIAFASFRDGNDEIYAMNADGSGQVDRTNNASGDVDPALSPDGQRIAFAASETGTRRST